MDPVSAFAFAGTLLTFVEFSYKVVAGTLEVAESGGIEGNLRLSAVVADLQNATSGLEEKALPPGISGGDSGHSWALCVLARQCRELSEELQAALGKLKLEEGDAKWKAIKVAMRSVRMKSDIERMQESLREFRSQILLRLLLMLNDRGETIESELRNFESRSEERMSRATRELDRLSHQILRQVEKGIQDGGEVLSAELQKQLGDIKHIREELGSLARLITAPSAEMRVLKQLYFHSMFSREDSMTRAAEGTFEWILSDDDDLMREEGEKRLYATDKDSDKSEEESDESEEDWTEPGKEGLSFPWSHKRHLWGHHHGLQLEQVLPRKRAKDSLKSWLRTGEGVFHVSGKAGSGKSTLMKLLVDHPQARAYLREWSENERLVVASFFFWMAGGNALQTSLDGLYRSILFETLQQCPELVREIFPEAHADFSASTAASSIDEMHFRPQKILRAMKRLTSRRTQDGVRYCFFIDGLDEYSGEEVGRLEHEELAEQLKSWTSSSDGRIKIMASSRPHFEFETAFGGDINLRIRLHELTALDIFRFGQQLFRSSPGFAGVRTFYKLLLAQVISAANGVFVWARTTLRTLVVAARRRPDLKYLRKHIEEQPRDLNALYEKLLTSIPLINRDRAFKLLLMVVNGVNVHHTHHHTLPLAVLEWLDKLDDTRFPFSCTERLLDLDYNCEDEVFNAEARLSDLSGGLLEIGSRTHNALTIQFFHRSAQDFVQSSPQLELFRQEVTQDDISRMVFRAGLACFWFAASRSTITHGRQLLLDLVTQSATNCLEQRIARGYVYGRNIGSLRNIGQENDFPSWEQVSKALAPHQTNGVDWRWSQSLDDEIVRWDPWLLPSFPHWLVSDANNETFNRWLEREPRGPSSSDGALTSLRSLVTSLAFRKTEFSIFEKWDERNRISVAFEHGWSPNEGVIFAEEFPFKLGTGRESTAWRVLCTAAAARMVQSLAGAPRWSTNRLCYKLERFIATREVDVDCQVLIGPAIPKECDSRNHPKWIWYPRRDRRPTSPGATHIISLRRLVSMFKPDNHDAIISLMDSLGAAGRPGLAANLLQTVWRSLGFSQASAAAAPEDPDSGTYLPYTLPDGDTDSNGTVLCVYSVKWKDAEQDSDVYIPLW